MDPVANTTTAAAPIPTDNPPAVAVLPESIPAATPEQLLTRVHARLSAVESTMASVAHRIESVAAALLERVEALVCKIGPAIEAGAAVAPGAIGQTVAKVAAVVEELCGCGHTRQQHTLAGCTIPGCTSCSTPPAA
jgi:hypothetical protein